VRRPSAVSGITGLHFVTQGASAQLVNMSPTGLLAETAAKLLVGTQTTVAFEGGFTPSTVDGRVVRCEVAVMTRDGELRYHIAVEFDSTLQFDEAEDASLAPSPPHVRNRW
jgi:hypothetical protein